MYTVLAFCPSFQGWPGPNDMGLSTNHSGASPVDSSSKSFRAQFWGYKLESAQTCHFEPHKYKDIWIRDYCIYVPSQLCQYSSLCTILRGFLPSLPHSPLVSIKCMLSQETSFCEDIFHTEFVHLPVSFTWNRYSGKSQWTWPIGLVALWIFAVEMFCKQMKSIELAG